MLVSARDMLEKAREGKYAVGQFNINNLEWTKIYSADCAGVKVPCDPGCVRGRRQVHDGL